MKLIKVLSIAVIIIILWNACRYTELEIEPDDLKISLRWVKGYPTETKEDVMTGLMWVLSFLGAEVSEESLEAAADWKSESRLHLNLEGVGFSEEAKRALKVITDIMKESEEYSAQGGIDIGRFVTLTLNSVHHYYAITGAEQRYSDFRSKYNFIDKRAGILNSAIAFGSRVIEISNAEQFDEIAFVATEGQGSIEDNSFVEKEFEALDFMPNGQLRFALYDLNGNLKTSATSSLTVAGKPAKCLWCHETSLIPPFADDHQLSGYYSTSEFVDILDDRMQIVNEYREQIGSPIFNAIPTHTKGELLYLSFMEPSAERLSLEWGISIRETEQILAGLPTHPHHEFSYLGDELYHRKDVDHLAPFKNLQIPTDARNHSEYEPDFIP